MESCCCTPRSDDELKLLTERLRVYVNRIKELRSEDVQVETSSFFKSVEVMEMEISNMKATYERELLRLRTELDGIVRARNHLDLRNGKLEASASELQTRTAAEIAANKKLHENIRNLQSEMQRKEVEFQQALQQAKESSGAAGVGINKSDSSKRLDQILFENQELMKKYEVELLQRRNFEDKAKQLQQQIDFNAQLHKQQIEEAQSRLSSTSAAFQTLEGKVRMMSHAADNDDRVNKMVAGIREAANCELIKYKKESEEAFARNVALLKAQMEADEKSLGLVNEENRRLAALVEELNAKSMAQQAEMVQLSHSKRVAEGSVQSERKRLLAHIQSLEVKMKEMQQVQFAKTKEITSARVHYVPLKAEVESLKLYMEEEEKRRSSMKLPVLSQFSSKAMISSSQQYGQTHGKIGANTCHSTQFVKSESCRPTGNHW